MKKLAFATLVMTCLSSWAAWDYMGTSNDKDYDIYNDISTIRKNGEIAKMWTLQDFYTTQINRAGEKTRSVKLLRAFNCRAETMANISIAKYSGQMGSGSVVVSGTLDEHLWTWNPIVPESIGETQWKIACGKN